MPLLVFIEGPVFNLEQHSPPFTSNTTSSKTILRDVKLYTTTFETRKKVPEELCSKQDKEY